MTTENFRVLQDEIGRLHEQVIRPLEDELARVTGELEWTKADVQVAVQRWEAAEAERDQLRDELTAARERERRHEADWQEAYAARLHELQQARERVALLEGVLESSRENVVRMSRLLCDDVSGEGTWAESGPEYRRSVMVAIRAVLADMRTRSLVATRPPGGHDFGPGRGASAHPASLRGEGRDSRPATLTPAGEGPGAGTISPAAQQPEAVSQREWRLCPRCNRPSQPGTRAEPTWNCGACGTSATEEDFASQRPEAVAARPVERVLTCEDVGCPQCIDLVAAGDDPSECLCDCHEGPIPTPTDGGRGGRGEGG